MMILVFTEEQNERLKYTFDFIFSERGLNYELTSDETQFIEFTGKKLNYSNREIESNLHVRPAELLFERGLQDQNLSLQIFDDWECLSFGGVTDVVASTFYVLSCYESYNSNQNDHHDRFPFKSSILNFYGWIDKAVCDKWSLSLIKLIDEEMYRSLVEKLKNSKPLVIPSFDIDNAYAYKYKRGRRKWLSIARDILNRDKERLRERRLVNGGKKKDPYDNYEKIEDVIKQYPETRIFWLTKSDGKFDRNLSLDVEEHQDLIKRLSKQGTIGLHPSYASFLNANEVTSERKILETITETSISQSRQHYLKLSLPESYRTLLSSGIKHDFSMGFAEHYGFRYGTARSFPWFDVERDQRTDLMINPFVYMDGTLNEYMNLDPSQSKKVISSLFKEVSDYGGSFCFIWHNETIGDYGIWKDWSAVLDHTLTLGYE